MATIKKNTNNKCWQECGEKRTLVHGWWECKLVQPLWKTVWRFLKKLKIELPYDPAIPLRGIYPKNTKRYKHPRVNCSTMYNSQDMKQSECPLKDEWIKKLWYVYTEWNIIQP